MYFSLCKVVVLLAAAGKADCRSGIYSNYRSNSIDFMGCKGLNSCQCKKT